MPSDTTEPSTDEGKNRMDLISVPTGSPLATVIRDATNRLPTIRNLQETDVIVLLTPVVFPLSQNPANISDPFEPLGRSLAKRHARIRHVPYTQRNGITSTHLAFIKRGQIIILCLVIPQRAQQGQQIQLDFADVAFAVSDDKPCIIVICCSSMENNLLIPFPTVIQCAGYTPAALEATASLLFTEPSPFNPNDGPTSTGSHQPRLWDVEQWNEARDMSNVLDLWTQNISSRFAIDQATLASLLRRPGYAKHYVVRDLRAGEILGFCATYLSYVDQEGERLIASLAILIVRPTNRQQGVGLSLHNHAISQLKKTRGVVRLQLGSTFPRILLGPPTGSNTNEEWFQRRGWQLNKGVPGQGLGLRDVVLDLQKWGYVEPSCSSLLQFRSCVKEDRIKVLAIVEHVCIRQCKMGWFDQYSALINGPNVKDIVLGVEKGMVVAVALTYTPSCGSPIASNLPWAGQIGNDVGGVTCVCICPSRNDSTIVGLLDTCVKQLKEQGMRKMFIDGVSNDLDLYKRLGFTEWAHYKDVWKDL